MRFRPCIDIHDGKVKQIVGGSLNDISDSSISRHPCDSSDSNATGVPETVRENYVSDEGAAFFASLYKSLGLSGGHIILLNKRGTEEYDADVNQAKEALAAYPGGFQIGGGITCDNAESMLNLGASHVIVTSYVFKDGKIYYDNLKNLSHLVGKKNLVIDLSCRRRDDGYYVVTDRWQRFTDVKLSKDTISMFGEYCDELLVHAVDVEGKASGIERSVVALLSNDSVLPATYAGGISSYEDIDEIERIGKKKVDFTVGSALDIFGGKLSLKHIADNY